MGTVVGVLIVVAAIGFGVYKGFVDPSYAPHSGKSRAWTQSCSEGDDALAIDEELTEQLAVDAAPTVLAIRERDGGSPAIVYFLSSEEAAIRGREEIVATIGEENDGDIDQRRSLIFAHPDRSDSEAAATFGHCLVEVSENRWADWTGIGAEQLAWPFSDK